MAKLVAERLKQSPFIGDYLNQEVFEANEAELISPSLRVYLPNELLAQAWKAKYTPKTVK
ncbi:MAG: hypothetical protein HC904_10520 [Blastochloris sp.]|nr:hypothetical protein [Blastochloris sp.]